jgi:endonuclease/exonuclease/phosphatase family metal-dependent hydrolase
VSAVVPLKSLPNQSTTLRLMSYNIQVGIGSTHPSHYLTKSWKHILPARQRLPRLDRIGDLCRSFDIVGLQELDAGSHRTGYVDLTAYLAERGGFPWWYHQLNRNFGRLAQHGNGLLSRITPRLVEEYRLPGIIPGRGALVAHFGHEGRGLSLVLVHLALGRRSRMLQLDFIADLIQPLPYAVVMGDFNTVASSAEMVQLFNRTELVSPLADLMTFPSWRPQRPIDHILVTANLQGIKSWVLNEAIHSDHLPIGMELHLPPACSLRFQDYHPPLAV